MQIFPNVVSTFFFLCDFQCFEAPDKKKKLAPLSSKTSDTALRGSLTLYLTKRGKKQKH